MLCMPDLSGVHITHLIPGVQKLINSLQRVKKFGLQTWLQEINVKVYEQ